MQDRDRNVRTWGQPNGAAGFTYLLGLIGAAVYYVQHASGFWPVILALLKAIVWPALVVYDALRALSG